MLDVELGAEAMGVTSRTTTILFTDMNTYDLTAAPGV